MNGVLEVGSKLGLDVIRSAKHLDRVQAWRERNSSYLQPAVEMLKTIRRLKIPTFYGALFVRVIKPDRSVLNYGLASLRVVTTVGAGFLVDAMQGLVEPELMKFHGLGTGNVAESAGDTILNAELTTLYSPANTRATGTLGEGSTAQVFKTVGTNTVGGACSVTEHGIFSAPTVGSGILLDRSVFAGIGLEANDSLETTYELTFATGG